jgi:thiosulfate dehydrogenase
MTCIAESSSPCKDAGEECGYFGNWGLERMKFLLGLVVGLLILPIAVMIYLRVGHPPVAVADRPFLLEKQIVRAPLQTRIEKEMPASAPIEASGTNLTTGAQVYREECAGCHGLYGRPSAYAAHMYPKAPQLWAPHRNGVVGVSDDPVGETEWKVVNGIRLTGMPAFGKVLNATQIWQVSVLLKNAGQPMPADVTKLLTTPLDYGMGTTAVVPSPAQPTNH